MHLFFEEDGAFKAGTVLSEAGSAYQVQLPTGRRIKIKASHVFFTFTSPEPSELSERSDEGALELDPAFLWEVAPEGEEFSYEVLAEDYWGGAGPVEKASLIKALHANPVYFYRKGRGCYRRAPADILEKALAALEKKRRLEELRKAWALEMKEGRLPPEIAAKAMELLLNPDKNGVEWKALSDASSERRESPLRCLLALGAVASPWSWHVESFYATHFPRGRGFPADLPLPPAGGWGELPLADVDAFSIDDSSTTEIDDAASVRHLGDGRTVVGVHIAAPALGILKDEPLDLVAQGRMSTVYAPGLKTTMLPENWVAAFSLDEGREVPCLSLYITVNDETFGVEKTETRLERIALKKNFRYDLIDELVTEERIASGTLEIPFAEEIAWLWHFAKKLLSDREEVRGRPEPVGRIDWFFDLEGEGEDAKIHLKGRRRGEPLDLLVAELMIFTNCTWGLWLEEHGLKGIYRSQRMGRVRMSTSPGPHDGLGVIRYAWSTSPLRRYVDLVNQRQIIAGLRGEPSPYAESRNDLFRITTDFEEIYGIYGEFQSKMERYWSLRWIEQETVDEIEAIIVRGDLVRIEGLPFMQRVPGLPEDLERGRRVRLRIRSCDLVDLVMDASLIEVLEDAPEAFEDDAEFEEAGEAPEEGPKTDEAPENPGKPSEAPPSPDGA